MPYNHQLQKAAKTELQKLLAVLPIYIFFFFITIHTILTKDSLLAKGISAVCFIIFATMFLLALRKIFGNKKRIN